MPSLRTTSWSRKPALGRSWRSRRQPRISVEELFISINELRDMANGAEEYSIGRVYQASEDGAKLRYARQLRDFGKSILDAFSDLPEGVMANSVTIRPDETMFGEEIELTWPVEDEE